jgi:hypothetical protein
VEDQDQCTSTMNGLITVKIMISILKGVVLFDSFAFGPFRVCEIADWLLDSIPAGLERAAQVQLSDHSVSNQLSVPATNPRTYVHATSHQTAFLFVFEGTKSCRNLISRC